MKKPNISSHRTNHSLSPRRFTSKPSTGEISNKPSSQYICSTKSKDWINQRERAKYLNQRRLWSFAIRQCRLETCFDFESRSRPTMPTLESTVKQSFESSWKQKLTEKGNTICYTIVQGWISSDKPEWRLSQSTTWPDDFEPRDVVESRAQCRWIDLLFSASMTAALVQIPIYHGGLRRRISFFGTRGKTATNARKITAATLLTLYNACWFA